MSERRPPTLREWIFIGGVMALGAGLFALFLHSRFYGITPEERLVTVKGFPEDAEVTGTSTLQFRVGNYPTEYGKDSPHYTEIVAAVENDELLEISVSSEKETWPRPGKMPLYKLNANGSPILLYSETADRIDKDSFALLKGAFVVWAIGALGLLQGFRNLRASREAPKPEAANAERKKEIVGAVFMSILLYAMLIGAPLTDSGSPSVSEKAFGPRPLGLPPVVVVVAASTLLYIPAPWIFWHLMRVMFRTREHNLAVGRNDLYLAAVLRLEIHRSRRIVYGGVVYFFVLVGLWIVYTAVFNI